MSTSWASGPAASPTRFPTKEVFRRTGIAIHTLRYMVDQGQITPARDHWNNLLWAEEDIRRAEEIMAARRSRRRVMS